MRYITEIYHERDMQGGSEGVAWQRTRYVSYTSHPENAFTLCPGSMFVSVKGSLEILAFSLFF